MKIDCPHCGVRGSIDDSLAGKKLRCPQCSKVFLVVENILPEVDAYSMPHQEIPSDEPQDLERVESIDALEEEVLEEEREEAEKLDPCSVCSQFFAPESLVEIDSKLYCALCQPDIEEEGLELLEEEDAEEVPSEELLEIIDEDVSDADAEEILANEDELFDLMDDAGEDELEDESDSLALLIDEDEADDLEEEHVEFETCSGCGESLHPDFLETIGSERLCALCIPEDEEDESEAESEEEGSEEIDIVQDEELPAEETDSVQALMGDDDEESFPKESCSVCGEKFHRDFMQEIDSKLYCGVCQPEVVEEPAGDEKEVAAGLTADTDAEAAGEEFISDLDFTVGELIKEAWQKTKGAKGAIWGGMIVMYLTIFTVSFGGVAAFQGFYKGTDPTTVMGANGVLQAVSSWLSMLMTGGIMLIGVRRVLGQRVSWKMVFAGFSKTLSITIALVLQTILVITGFILLILPGIYLSVGYALTLPLILDKGMGPWEALEASRKAIHKKWWTVFGLYLVMVLLYLVSAIPLGLGLIWTVPMFFVLIGVLYVRLFGSGETIEEGEGIEEENQEESSEEALEVK